MADFYYCLGVFLDEGFCEKTCKKRDNCKYYDVNLFNKYADIIDRFDFLICDENCRYYLPKREEQPVSFIGDEDPFKIN